MNDQALRDYFDFDEVDLNANRNGRLSKKQKKKLPKRSKYSRKYFIDMGLSAIVIAFIFPIISIIFPMAFRGPEEFCGFFAWEMIWVGIGFLSLFRALTFREDFYKVIFKKAEGPINMAVVKTSIGQGYSYLEHEIHIGEEKFVVDEDLAVLMNDEDIYAIYFYQFKNSRSNHILSAERLSKLSS